MNVCGSAFSGIGLLDYGLALAGWKHAFLCESEADRRAILHLRWPGVPVYEDVRDLDGSAPRVDLFAFGFPCRGASTAGLRTGLDHPETALWREAARVIRALRPRLVLVENVANLLAVRDGGAWAEVLGDLAALGYVCAWDCLPAAAFGAPHRRDRVFCIACDPDQMAGPSRESRDGRSGTVAQPRSLQRLERSARHTFANGNGGGCGETEQGLREREPDPEGSVAPDPELPSRRSEGECDQGPGTIASRPAGWVSGRSANALDTRQGRQQERTPEHVKESAESAPHPDRLGLSVPWREYAPAIRRWEAIAGPAPEPLVRRMDDRAAAGVERSRLSALGDGVQVQAGHYLGARLMELEA